MTKIVIKISNFNETCINSFKIFGFNDGYLLKIKKGDLRDILEVTGENKISIIKNIIYNTIDDCAFYPRIFISIKLFDKFHICKSDSRIANYRETLDKIFRFYDNMDKNTREYAYNIRPGKYRNDKLHDLYSKYTFF
jgi:hypothetical protein